jgi:hypothetical protein
LPGSIFTSGEPEESFTWFPGYAWQMLGCKACGNAVGWKFTSVDGKEDQHPDPKSPPKFYGLMMDELLFEAEVHDMIDTLPSI